MIRAALLAALVALAPAGAARAQSLARDGVFVLGVDGMDPVILQRLIDAGQMPEFQRLASEGSFQPLATINPPQSPVAWSSFVTGLDPGGHGIFDFIHRDPQTGYPMASATAPVDPADQPGSIDLFGWIIPTGALEVPNNRSGTPYWDVLQRAGVKTEVYRMPGNFPVPTSEALTLSGMGTVDLRGDYGTYTWYTDDAFIDRSRIEKADLTIVTVDDEDLDGIPDTVRTRLKGPPDVFRLKPGQAPKAHEYLTVPVTFHLDPEEPVVWIRAGDAECVLREGEIGEWLHVSFDALPLGMMPLSGIVRFYAKSLRPRLAIHASPVNVDPTAPAQVIATPDGAAEALAEAIGPYWTQGFPEDINAYKDRLFDDDDYRKQIAVVHAEGERMLDEALARFSPGDCTFMYLSDIDLQCHLLWRHGDPKHADAPRHPGWDEHASPKHALDIEGYYRNVDRLLGKVRAALPEGTLLLVISDHGFQPMTRQVHLNAWLRDNGWLTLKDGKRTGSIALDDVDWAATKAYAIGFNGLYLNLAGRESQGLVPPGEVEAVTAELVRQLLAWRDPAGGKAPVLRVDRSADIYSAARRGEGPDLVVGYDAGYGCSDESTLGEITEAVIEDNTHGFTGSHLMAPEVVPGVLLSSRRLPGSGFGLTDITATLLQHFGQPPTPGMAGRSIFSP